jgi:hypothetical protein
LRHAAFHDRDGNMKIWKVPRADPIERFGSRTVVLGGALGVLGCDHVIHASRPVCSRPVEFRTVVPHCRRCDLFRRY